MARVTADVLAEALSIQPTGGVWELMRSPASNFAAYLGPLAGSLSDLETAAESELEEIDPLTCNQLLTDWETLLDLPDPCAGINPDVAYRKAQARARLTDQGGISVSAIQGYALALGFTVTITEFRPAQAGITSAEQPVADDTWAYSWLVSQISDNGGAVGSVSAIRQAVLTCEVQRIKPAHTIAFFDWTS